MEACVVNLIEPGDRVIVCVNGVFGLRMTDVFERCGAIVHTLPAREASEMLVSKARQRARGGGDNLSLALVRISALK